MPDELRLGDVARGRLPLASSPKSHVCMCVREMTRENVVFEM